MENLDVEPESLNLISLGDDLLKVLKDARDVDLAIQCLDSFEAIQSSSHSDFNELYNLIKVYENKRENYKEKRLEAESEIANEAAIDSLEKELEAELEREQALKEELSALSSIVDNLEKQTISNQEQKKALKKLEQEEFKTRKMLSMYASVTSIIPNLDDQSRISGYMVDSGKTVIEKFEFDPAETTAYDTCSSIWNMIKKQ